MKEIIITRVCEDKENKRPMLVDCWGFLIEAQNKQFCITLIDSMDQWHAIELETGYSIHNISRFTKNQNGINVGDFKSRMTYFKNVLESIDKDKLADGIRKAKYMLEGYYIETPINDKVNTESDTVKKINTDIEKIREYLNSSAEAVGMGKQDIATLKKVLNNMQNSINSLDV